MARSWSPEEERLIQHVAQLDQGGLPRAPWVLHSTQDRHQNGVFVRGGPLVTITDNRAWLRSIMVDVAQGPAGPRARNGMLQRDLRALLRVLVEEV